MRESTLKRAVGVLYVILIIGLSLLFFTNDFGLVDLRKTSVIIGVGLDYEDDEVNLTAQLAVPQSAENGENTQFTVVTGKGATVAGALNEVNLKTGFYPKLVFCKLILLGESCLTENCDKLLDYFFDNEYTGLTPKLAACKGKASEIMSTKLPFGDSTTDFIERLLSEEAQKSGNVSTADLNKFGQGVYSESGASYMPFIQLKTEQGESSGESGGGQESQGGGGSGGQESQGGGGQSSQGGGEKSGGETEFLCNQTAAFTDGYFRGVLSGGQAFAFNLINSDLRHVYVQCGNEVLGLRGCDGGAELKIENGAPVLKLSFSAKARLLDGKEQSGGKIKGDSRVPDEVLKKGEEQIKGMLVSLFDFAKSSGCDLIGAKDLLYKYHNRQYEIFKDVLYDKAVLVTDVKLSSAS